MEKKQEADSILEQKLEDLKNDMGDQDTSFITYFAMDLPFSANVQNVNNDPIRERAFQEATLAGVVAARDFMVKNKIDFVQPATAYVPKERIKQTPIPKKYEGKKLNKKEIPQVPVKGTKKNRK